MYIENKTTKIRLSPCVHITFKVTFRYLWMLTSYVTGGMCSPLKKKKKKKSRKMARGEKKKEKGKMRKKNLLKFLQNGMYGSPL